MVVGDFSQSTKAQSIEGADVDRTAVHVQIDDLMVAQKPGALFQ